MAGRVCVTSRRCRHRLGVVVRFATRSRSAPIETVMSFRCLSFKNDYLIRGDKHQPKLLVGHAAQLPVWPPDQPHRWPQGAAVSIDATGEVDPAIKAAAPDAARVYVEFS